MKTDEPIYVGPQGRELALDPTVVKRLEELMAALAAQGRAASAETLVSSLLTRAMTQLDLPTLKKLVKEAMAREG